MDIDELKKIIEREKGKVIVVEQGMPSLVIMNFDDYKRMTHFREGNSASRQDFFSRQESNRIPEELLEDPLKIEDLPFK